MKRLTLLVSSFFLLAAAPVPRTTPIGTGNPLEWKAAPAPGVRAVLSRSASAPEARDGFALGDEPTKVEQREAARLVPGAKQSSVVGEQGGEHFLGEVFHFLAKIAGCVAFPAHQRPSDPDLDHGKERTDEGAGGGRVPRDCALDEVPIVQPC